MPLQLTLRNDDTPISFGTVDKILRQIAKLRINPHSFWGNLAKLLQIFNGHLETLIPIGGFCKIFIFS